MGFISPSLSEPHPQMKHTVTACWGHNQLPHFLGDSLKSLERAFFQFEVFENDNPLYITAKYLISAHVRGQWRAIRKPLEWRRPWEGWWDLIFLVKKKIPSLLCKKRLVLWTDLIALTNSKVHFVMSWAHIRRTWHVYHTYCVLSLVGWILIWCSSIAGKWTQFLSFCCWGDGSSHKWCPWSRLGN